MKFGQRFPWGLLFAGVSLTHGLLVPTIIEWGEKPFLSASRQLVLQQMAIGVLVVTLLAVAAVFRLNGRPASPDATNDESTSETEKRTQFTIREIFIATTVVGVSLVILPRLEGNALSLFVLAIAAGTVVWSIFQDWTVRARLATLMAVMFLPFVWLIAYNKPFGYSSGLIEYIPLGPPLILSMLITNALNLERDAVEVVSTILVSIQLLAGAWIVRKGKWLANTYIFFVMVLSAFCSLVLHVMYRV